MSAGGATPVRLSPAGLFDSSHLGFTQVVVAPPGASLVFVAGQLAEDQDAGFEDQVMAAFAHLGAALRAAGATPGTVLRITCLVVDHDVDRRDVVSAARRRFFGDESPASTIIPVPGLAGGRALFEVDAVAMVPTPHPEGD